MKLSKFGKKFTGTAGITSLMDDLGNALASGQDLIMMGGGNPAHVPAVEAVFKKRLEKILNDTESFRRLIGIYDPPAGNHDFISALVSLFRKEYGWDISEKNIALTNGSQSAFFSLFNMFAGEFDDGTFKKIRLPLAPEYIGYADAGLNKDFFVSTKPKIDTTGENRFKYRVDFHSFDIGSETGAICVSRPTNPTGNVLTDDEIVKLDALARQHKIPLILDNAYGFPFPGLIFKNAKPFWNENTILCMSLSKLGLPATRTGITIASEEIIRSMAGINAILNLSTGGFGGMLAMDIVKSGEIIDLSNNVIRPYYETKLNKALKIIKKEFQGLDYAVHEPEGAMFIWLWLKDLPITSLELYERLKRRGVIVVSGHYFFTGISSSYKHRDECLRITYSQNEAKVSEGLRIIAEEVRKAVQ